eukprot:9441946-Alexandrium_andersonii.AAC.1
MDDIVPEEVVYGEKSGLPLDREKVIQGRLLERKQMNDHHVYDEVPEAEKPAGVKVETSRWLEDIKGDL